MKRNQIYYLIITGLFITICLYSCKKSQDVLVSNGSGVFENSNKDVNIPILKNVNPGNISQVFRRADGQYGAIWGGVEISFGTTFLVPTNSSFTFGESWSPSTGEVIGNNIFSSSQYGSFFSFTYGTFVNGLGTNINSAISSYYTALYKYLGGEGNSSDSPNLGDYLVRSGGSDDGTITVSGQFILDPSSPTKVSIAEAGFASKPSQLNSDVVNGYLGELKRGNVTYYLTGYSGKITKVTKHEDGFLDEDVTNFDGIYLVAIRVPVIAIDLTLYPNTSNEINFVSENVSNIYR